MVGRQHDPHRVVEQMNAVEILAQDVRRAPVLVVEHDRQVEVAPLERRDGHVGLALGEAQLDLGMLSLKPRDRLGDEGRARAREARQADAAAAEAGDRGELALGVRELGEDRVGAGDERTARVGEADAPGAALRRVAPVSRSSAAICWLIADCV